MFELPSPVNAESVAREELENNAPKDFEKIDTEKVRQTINQINQALTDKSVVKKVKQKLNYGRKNWPDNLDKYDKQEKQLGNRRRVC